MVQLNLFGEDTSPPARDKPSPKLIAELVRLGVKRAEAAKYTRKQAFGVKARMEREIERKRQSKPSPAPGELPTGDGDGDASDETDVPPRAADGPAEGGDRVGDDSGDRAAGRSAPGRAGHRHGGGPHGATGGGGGGRAVGAGPTGAGMAPVDVPEGVPSEERIDPPCTWHLFPWDRPTVDLILAGLMEMRDGDPERLLPGPVFWGVRHLPLASLRRLCDWLLTELEVPGARRDPVDPNAEGMRVEGGGDGGRAEAGEDV